MFYLYHFGFCRHNRIQSNTCKPFLKKKQKKNCTTIPMMIPIALVRMWMQQQSHWEDLVFLTDRIFQQAPFVTRNSTLGISQCNPGPQFWIYSTKCHRVSLEIASFCLRQPKITEKSVTYPVTLLVLGYVFILNLLCF